MKEFHVTVRIELTFADPGEISGDGDCPHVARAGGLAVIRTQPAAAACLRGSDAGWRARPASPRPETCRRQCAGLRAASRAGTFML
jgi:hypothetical protein